MQNSIGEIIYVGKSVNLRDRLASYFHSKQSRDKVGRLGKEINGIEVILTNNENESLVLENNLIKYYKPKFNRVLKKGSTVFPYIKITDERLPRLAAYDTDRMSSCDLPKEDKQRRMIYGPFPNPKYRDVVLELITSHFKLRTCESLPNRVCMSYYLGTCSGICEKHRSEEEYMLSVYEAQETLLEDDRIMLLLKRQMNDASERLEFEKAQQIKTKLDLLIRMQEEQIVDRHVSYHQDVVYFGRERALIAKVEFGKIRSALSMYDLDPELSYDNACRQLLMQLYSTDSPAK